jgi:hypothetical protein
MNGIDSRHVSLMLLNLKSAHHDNRVDLYQTEHHRNFELNSFSFHLHSGRGRKSCPFGQKNK